jgi:hypothetical protein
MTIEIPLYQTRRSTFVFRVLREQDSLSELAPLSGSSPGSLESRDPDTDSAHCVPVIVPPVGGDHREETR